LVLAASKVNPSSIEKYKTIPLSRSSLTRRIEVMGDNVNRQLKKRAGDFVSYPLALDESIDTTLVS